MIQFGLVGFLLLMLISATAVSTVVAHPIQFIGELIFTTGDTSKPSDEIMKLYESFLGSEEGIACIMYIGEISVSDGQTSYSKEYYLLPCLMTVRSEDEADLSHLKVLLLKAHEIRLQEPNDIDYIQALKQTDAFQNIKQLSDSTILSYIEQLAFNPGTDHLPTCTEDLRKIAQNDIYIGLSNPFIPTYRGQCTWWAYSRCLEVTGIRMPTNNARSWYKNTDLEMGNQPRSQSVLALWDDGDGKQHVIFVEDYRDGIITISEGNTGGDGTLEYTREHYLDLLRYTKTSYEMFKTLRIDNYDHYVFIYTH